MNSSDEKIFVAAVVKRWGDSEQAVPLLCDLKRFLAKGHLDHTLDLRGIDLMSSDGSWDFQLISGEFRDADISFGKGSIEVNSAKVEKLIARGFTFHQATRFLKCQFIDSDFEDASFKCFATDVEFKNCVFRNSVFMGFELSGFQRCVFHECNFEGIRWKNTYLRAVQFHQCKFNDAIFETNEFAGVRFFGFSDWKSIVKDCRVQGIYVDGVRLELEIPG